DLALAATGVFVGGDQALVDAVGDLHGDVRIVGGERRPQAGLLLVGQQLGPGVQGPTYPVQGIAAAPSVAGGGLLDALAAHGELVRGQVHHVEGIHDRARCRYGVRGGGVVAGEPVHRDNLDSVAECLVAGIEPVGQ